MNQDLSLKRLAEIIRENFGPPFLPKGLVQARASETEFRLKIGPRDIHIDGSGGLLAAGMDRTFGIHTYLIRPKDQ